VPPPGAVSDVITFAPRTWRQRHAVVMAHHGTTQYDSDRSAIEPLLTLSTVCGVLAVSKQTVYRLVRQGELRPTRVGDRLRFEPEDVRDYVSRHREVFP
jgi:excisionase family DNA binding protein